MSVIPYIIQHLSFRYNRSFRYRRHRMALTQGLNPWTYKVDGSVAKRKTDRDDEGRHTKQITVGDMAYADDTAIMGIEREVLQTEPILIQTIKDFDGKVNENKT